MFLPVTGLLGAGFRGRGPHHPPHLLFLEVQMGEEAGETAVRWGGRSREAWGRL